MTPNSDFQRKSVSSATDSHFVMVDTINSSEERLRFLSGGAGQN
ncbi:MAG: hypothetical protein ACI9BW_002818 [Gammaproteobacteria bacterium]|jgi:hypothetical protein